MTLLHCTTEIQRNFYRELSLVSQGPIALSSVQDSQPAAATNRSSLWARRTLAVCLGAKVLLLATSLACQVITQVSAYLNVQEVLIY